MAIFRKRWREDPIRDLDSPGCQVVQRVRGWCLGACCAQLLRTDPRPPVEALKRRYPAENLSFLLLSLSPPDHTREGPAAARGQRVPVLSFLPLPQPPEAHVGSEPPSTLNTHTKKSSSHSSGVPTSDSFHSYGHGRGHDYDCDAMTTLWT